MMEPGLPDRKPRGEDGVSATGQIVRFIAGALIPLPLQFVVGFIGLEVFGFHGPREGQWLMVFWPLAYVVPLVLISRRASIGFCTGIIASCAVMILLNLGCAGVVAW